MLCLFAALCGCEKASEPSSTGSQAPGAVVDRMKDPAYTNALKTARDEQVDVARRAMKLRPQLESFEKKARAALPKDATAEQVRSELTGHPERYPGWRELDEQMARFEATLKARQAKARVLVRARVEKEAAERAAAK